MMIIGHKLIPHKKFFEIFHIDSILQSSKDDILLFGYDEDLIWNCQQNGLDFALHVESVKELILANGVGAKFAIVDESLLSDAQELAEHYLFDTKVAIFAAIEEVEAYAKLRVDAIILPSGVK